MSESMRERGIGSVLYGKAMEKFSANERRRVLIFTDDCGVLILRYGSCRKAREIPVSLRFEELRIMLYIKDLDIDGQPVAVRHL